MARWTIGIHITGSRIDAAGLARLVDFLRREFPDFDTDCALWSGRLAVHAAVGSATPVEALDAVVKAVDLAFDEADIDASRASEITNVTMQREHVTGAPDRDSLPQVLLRRVFPSRRF